MPARLSFFGKVVLYFRVFFDRRTPMLPKILMTLGLLYGFSPLDIIPDIVPVLGQLDDIAVLIPIILAFIRMTRSIADELRRESTTPARPGRGEVIDV